MAAGALDSFTGEKQRRENREPYAFEALKPTGFKSFKPFNRFTPFKTFRNRIR
jgi:hypothetical protein